MGENERLCAMEPCLGCNKFPPLGVECRPARDDLGIILLIYPLKHTMQPLIRTVSLTWF